MTDDPLDFGAICSYINGVDDGQPNRKQEQMMLSMNEWKQEQAYQQYKTDIAFDIFKMYLENGFTNKEAASKAYDDAEAFLQEDMRRKAEG